MHCAATNMWRRLHVAAGSRKGGPPALCGHAIAASDGKIWVAGGRTGRKLHRRTFCLDTGAGRQCFVGSHMWLPNALLCFEVQTQAAVVTSCDVHRPAETLAWTALKDSQHAPVGVADLSLTAVGEHGVVGFGGLGAKGASSQLALLQPAFSTWRSLTTIGVSLHGRASCRASSFNARHSVAICDTDSNSHGQVSSSHRVACCPCRRRHRRGGSTQRCGMVTTCWSCSAALTTRAPLRSRACMCCR